MANVASLRFEGDISNFSEPQINLIKRVLKEMGFEDNKVNIESVGKKGDNFSSFVKRIIVQNGKELPFKMIAKVAPSIEAFRNAMNTALIFRNEIIMYNEVLKTYAELLDTEGIPKSNSIKIPVCYGFLVEAPNEIILLEDLQELGYALLDIQNPLSDSNLKLALKELAIFHSLAFVVRNRNPDTFTKMKSQVLDLRSELNMLEKSKVWMLKLEEDLFELMDEDKYKDVVKGFTSQLALHAEESLSYDFESKYSVIQQGDFYINNVMYKKDNNPSEVVMIDYQVSRVASPASDLLYMFLSCTEYNDRCKHFYDWLDYYYFQLKSSLDFFGLNVADVYPREILDADLKRHGKLALILSLMVVNAIIVKSGDELADFKDSTEKDNAENAAEAGRFKNLSAKTREKLKIRVKGCIDSMIEFGYL